LLDYQYGSAFRNLDMAMLLADEDHLRQLLAPFMVGDV
jgi:hypothetical protein